jgi:hypothetical protein
VFGTPACWAGVGRADVDRLAGQRPLDLAVSTAPPFDLLGMADDAILSGELAGVAELEYRLRLFRDGSRIYRGDLFVGVGVFALHARGEDGLPAGTLVDLTFDVGVRLDTMIGVFELGLANGLGRLPL